MSPDDVMHPLLLTFQDKGLEEAYQKYALYRRHRAGDLRFFFVASVVVLSVAVKTAALHNWSLLPALPSFLCGLLPVVLWVIYLKASTTQIIQMRPYMSAACRLGIAITGCVSKHSFSWMFALASPAPFAIVQFLMATETFGNAAYAFGMTLNFREHLPIQILTFVIFIFGKAETACERISESAGVAALNRLESVLDEFFESWVSFLLSTMGSFRNDSIPKLPCLHLTTFLMSFFSMGVVSYVVWIWEHRLRIQFLNSQSPRTWHLNFKTSDNTFNCVRYLTLISLAALFWKFSVPFTNLIKWLG